jgi:hypothetical protein
MDREEDRCDTREEAIKRGAEVIYNRAYNDAVNVASKVALKCYKSLLKWAAELAGIEPADVDAERAKIEEARLAAAAEAEAAERAKLEEAQTLTHLDTEGRDPEKTVGETQYTQEPASHVEPSKNLSPEAEIHDQSEDHKPVISAVTTPASIQVRIVPEGIELVIEGVRNVLTVDAADSLSDQLMSAVMTRREQKIINLPAIQRH